MMIRRATGRINSFTDENGIEQKAVAPDMVWATSDPEEEPLPFELPVKDALDLDQDTNVDVDLYGDDDDDIVAKRC